MTDTGRMIEILLIICSLLAGIALSVTVFILIYRYREGRKRRKGRKGEKLVGKVLAGLKKRDNIVINDVLIPGVKGNSTQIDHLVISTRGIFVIETKSMSGRISGAEHSQYWTQYFNGGSRQFYNPILQNRGHIKSLRKILKDVDEDTFVSFIIFTEAWRLEIKADDITEHRSWMSDRNVGRTFHPSEQKKKRWWQFGREVRLDERCEVLKLDELTGEIQRRKKILSRSEIKEIAESVATQTLSGRKAERTHVKYARETSRNIYREIRAGICPRCGGCLVMRRGEKGEFIGCENYPECRFTCSADCLH